MLSPKSPTSTVWSSASADVAQSVRNGVAASFRLRYVLGTAWRLLLEMLFILAFWALLSQLVWLMTGSPLLVFDAATVQYEPIGIRIAQDLAMLLFVALVVYRAFVASGMVICYAAAALNGQAAEPRAIREFAEARWLRLVRTDVAAQVGIVVYTLIIICPLFMTSGFTTSVLTGVNEFLSAPLLILVGFTCIRVMTSTDSVRAASRYAIMLIRRGLPSVIACAAMSLIVTISLQEFVRVSAYVPILGEFIFLTAYVILFIEILLLRQIMFVGLLICVALYRRLEHRVEERMTSRVLG